MPANSTARPCTPSAPCAQACSHAHRPVNGGSAGCSASTTAPIAAQAARPSHASAFCLCVKACFPCGWLGWWRGSFMGLAVEASGANRNLLIWNQGSERLAENTRHLLAPYVIRSQISNTQKKSRGQKRLGPRSSVHLIYRCYHLHKRSPAGSVATAARRVSTIVTTFPTATTTTRTLLRLPNFVLRSIYFFEVFFLAITATWTRRDF